MCYGYNQEDEFGRYYKIKENRPEYFCDCVKRNHGVINDPQEYDKIKFSLERKQYKQQILVILQ